MKTISPSIKVSSPYSKCFKKYKSNLDGLRKYPTISGSDMRYITHLFSVDKNDNFNQLYDFMRM